MKTPSDEEPLIDLLLDVWQQFALPVPGYPGVTMDGALSVLEDVAEVLRATGRLERVAGHPDKEWWCVTDLAVARSEAALATIRASEELFDGGAP